MAATASPRVTNMPLPYKPAFPSSSEGRPLCLAIIEAEDAEKWQGLTEVITSEAFGRTGDTFHVYHAPGGSLPSEEDLDAGKYDAIIIGSSHHSANDDYPWVHRLSALLRRCVDQGRPRLLAVCFGHQLLAKSLGGTVGQNPTGRFVLKVEDVKFDAAAMQQHNLSLVLDNDSAQALHGVKHYTQAEAGELHGGGKGLQQPDGTQTETEQAQQQHRHQNQQQHLQQQDRDGVWSVPIIQSHGDQVLELPPGAVLLASSDTAAVEAWILPGRALACQFHAEFPGTEIVLDKIHSALTASGRLNPQEAEESEVSLRNSSPNPWPVRAMFRAFLEGRQGNADQSTPSNGASMVSSIVEAPRSLQAAGAMPAPTPGPHAQATSETSLRGARVTQSHDTSGKASCDFPGASAGAGDNRAEARGTPGDAVSGPHIGITTRPEVDAVSSKPIADDQHPTDDHNGPSLPVELAPSQLPEFSSDCPEEGTASGADVGPLGVELQQLVSHMRAAFGAGLDQGSLQWQQLAAVNQVANGKCGELAATAEVLANFSQQLSEKQGGAQAALDAVPELEAQLQELYKAVDALDAQSRQLARDVGVKEPSGLESMFAWR